MLVDAHLHIWRPAPDYPNPGVTIVNALSDVPVELLREYMTEHGVDRAVLVQPMFPGEDNGYVADCAAADAKRCAAVCVVDPRTPGAEDRLAYWVQERGCKGLRLRPRLPEESAIFGDPAMFPLWERARDLKVVVNVLGSPEHLPVVAALAERFPDVPILLDHMAYPDVTLGVQSSAFQDLLTLARYPQLHIKVSGQYYYSRQLYPFADCHEFFRAVYDRFGPLRLIWGSDFPHVLLKVGYRRSLLLLERAYPFLCQTDLELIMGANAVRLYWT